VHKTVFGHGKSLGEENLFTFFLSLFLSFSDDRENYRGELQLLRPTRIIFRGKLILVFHRKAVDGK
jgi:hypothetical protein